MKFSKTEKGFVTFLVALIVLFAVLLYLDVTSRLKAQGEVIGTVTFKKNTVQRKFTNQVIWEGVDNTFPVMNRDTIRTADEADAELTLNDGTKIQLDENSMIFLDISAGKTTIGFNYGSVQADKGSDGKSDIEIQSGNKVVKLKDDTELKLAKKEDESLLVSVTKGAADFLFGGKKQEIGKDESATLEKDATDIKVEKINLKPVSPQENSRFITNQEKQQIDFSFEKEKNMKEAIIEISGSRNFNNTIASFKTTESRVTTNLGDGIYYWRIRGDKQISPVSKFIVIVNSAAMMIAPAENAVYNETGQELFVNFIWRKNKTAASYKVEIAQDSEFKQIVQSATSRMNSIAFPMKEGDYYWRVTALDPMGSAPAISGARKFSITRQEILVDVNLFNPSSNAVIYKSIAAEKGILFNWNNNRSYTNYDIQLSTDSRFDKILKSENTQAAYLQIKENLDSGNYFWRVRGVSASGKKGNFSEIGKFVVKDIKTLQTIAPTQNTRYSEDDVNGSGVTFIWEKLPVIGKYRVAVAKDSSLQRASFTESTFDRVSVKNIPQGDVFWKVSLLDEAGKEIISSSVAKFTVTEEKNNPVPLSPPNKSQIVGIDDIINFQWVKSSGGSEYVVRLYTIRGNKKEQIFSGKSTTANLVFPGLHELGQGNYRWSIATVSADGKEGEEISSDFSIIKSIVLISPGKSKEFTMSEMAQKGIGFRWIKLPTAGKYRLTLATDEKMNQKVNAIVTENNAILMKETAPGVYYWKVTMIDDRGHDVIHSPVSSIVVKEEVASTTKGTEEDPSKMSVEKKMVRGFYPISPPDQDIINPEKQKSIVFEFNKSFFSQDYELVLYTMKGEKLAVLFTKRMSQTRFEYNQVNDLGKGEYFWNITAFDTKGKAVEEIFGTFSVGKNGKNYREFENVEILSPLIQYSDH